MSSRNRTQTCINQSYTNGTQTYTVRTQTCTNHTQTYTKRTPTRTHKHTPVVISGAANSGVPHCWVRLRPNGAVTAARPAGSRVQLNHKLHLSLILMNKNSKTIGSHSRQASQCATEHMRTKACANALLACTGRLTNGPVQPLIHFLKLSNHNYASAQQS